MSVGTVLRKLVKVVSDEANRNPEFAERLRVVLEPARTPRHCNTPSARNAAGARTRRGANRRPAAILDPVALAAIGEQDLRAELSLLSLEQLKDIIAEYGMDQDRLAMKWKTPSRVINRIVEMSISRAHKGEAFRS